MTPSGMIPFNLKLRNLIAQTMFQTDNKVISKTQDISWQSKINNFPLDFHEKMYFQYQPVKGINYLVQCNLDLVTLNLVTTCDLVTVFYKDRFSIYYTCTRTVCAPITCGLYIFYPIFEDHFLVFKEVFSENSTLMYG